MPLETERSGKRKEGVSGGFLGGFWVVARLLAMYYYRRIMEE
jgi:hypothetical protein